VTLADATETTEAQVEQPAAEQPVAEKQEAEQPVAEKQEAEQPIAEKQEAEQPIAEKQEAEQPVAEKQEAEQPVAEKQEAEQPVAEKQEAEQPADKQPVAEKQEAEQPAAEQPVAEKQEAEQPADKQPESKAAIAKGPAEAPRRKKKSKVKVIPRKRVVKVLSVGMEVNGKVKRISDFGAFVDIGVGRDGLLHISELAPGRVHKVSDVVKEGEEVTVWIKDLDREKNRISLTMIPPGTRTIRDLEVGELVKGTVQRLTSYGAFLDIGLERDAMLHVKEMGDGYVAKPEDVVKVGDEIEARIIGVDQRRGRIDLSLKGLRLASEDAGNEVELAPLDFADDEEDVPTPMELAFRQAFEGDLPVKDTGRSRRQSRRKRKESRYEQSEIISRTLRYSEDR